MSDSVREQLHSFIDSLSDAEVQVVLDFAKEMHITEKDEADSDYDPDKDGTVAIFSGPTNVAGRVKEILAEDARRRGGWTQKDPE